MLTRVIWFQTVKRSAISCRHPLADSRCRRGRKCGEMRLNADRNRCGTVKLVGGLVAAKIGGRGRCIVVVQGTPVPAGDHRPLRVAVSPVPAELS